MWKGFRAPGRRSKRSRQSSAGSVDRELVHQLAPLPRNDLQVVERRRPGGDHLRTPMRATLEEHARAAQVVARRNDDETSPVVAAAEALDRLGFALRAVGPRMEADD